MRFGARLIDVIVRAVVSACAGLLYGVTVAVAAISQGASPVAATARGSALKPSAVVIAVTASVIYHAVAEGISGASLGKLLCGLRVTTPTLGRASAVGVLVRNAAIVIDGLFVGLVGYSAMSSSEKKQRYGDRWGDTVVVHADGAPEAVRGTTGALALGVVLSLAVDFVLALVGLFVARM